jgi:hypothetical protein
MSKNQTTLAGQPAFPETYSRGVCPDHVGDRTRRFRLAAPRPVNSPLGGAVDSVKPFF